MEYRCVSKKFKCGNCLKRFRKLVNSEEMNTTCENCNGEAVLVNENEFDKEEADRTYRLAFDNINANVQREYHPRTDILDRDPSNLYGDPRRRTVQSTINQTSQTNQNNARSTTNTTNNSTQRTTTEQSIPSQPRQQPIINRTIRFRQVFIPYSISPFNGSVNSQPTENMRNIFTHLNSFFLIPNSEFFMDNFASNFVSSFEDPLTRLVFLQSMQNQPQGTPPASKESIQSLKKFKMNEEYCKKNEKGELEYPSCTVCLTEINQNDDTVIVPCGHMFHDSCIMQWLEMHNTCPVCRYELPTENPDYERIRLQRQQNRQTNSNTGNTATI